MDSFQSTQMGARENINKNGDIYKKTGSYVFCMAKILETNQDSFEGVVKNLQMGVNVIETEKHLINESSNKSLIDDIYVH